MAIGTAGSARTIVLSGREKTAVRRDAPSSPLKRWVNTATPEELSSVLGLPAKVAAAVVDYRKEHGNFTDLAGLLKVDGVDKAKLEEQPEALRFD